MGTTRELLDRRYGPAHDVSARDALNPALETIRREYEGRTLREHYGLARPANRNERAALRGAAE